MAQIIKIKRSTATTSPTSLQNGELAYSVYNGTNKLYIGRPGGTTGDIDVIGGKYYVDIIDGATDANTADKLVLRDGSGNFSAGTITATFSGNITGNITSTGTSTFTTVDINGGAIDGTAIGGTTPSTGAFTTLSANAGITGDLTGDVTGNADTATTWATARDLSLTGDATATLSGVNGSANVSAALTLATVNSNVGSFGSTTAIPVITVNGKGLVTAASTVSIATTLVVQSDDAVNNSVDLATDTLKILGGTGITTSNTGDDITISGDDATTTTKGIASFNSTNFTVTSGAVSTNNITAAGDSGTTTVTNGGTITFAGTANEIETAATSGTITIGLPSDVTITNDLSVGGDTVITGNLTVNGTTTTVNSNTVSVGDNIIVLNGDETGTPSQNAGIEIERGTSSNVAFRWNETSDKWEVTRDGTNYYVMIDTNNFEAEITTLDGGTF